MTTRPTSNSSSLNARIAAAMQQVHAREQGSVSAADTRTSTARPTGASSSRVKGANGGPNDAVGGASMVMGSGQPGTPAHSEGGWNKSWEKKFSDIMRAAGVSEAEIREQVKVAQGQGLTDAELRTAYDGMKRDLGAFNVEWRNKFDAQLTKMGASAEEKAQTLNYLSTSALTSKDLQDAFAKLQSAGSASGGNAPVKAAQWTSDLENNFKALDLPQELIDSAKAEVAKGADPQKIFQHFLDVKLKYKNSGELDKLLDAGATSQEKWATMLEDLHGEAFDKRVDQIKSGHVSGWKRVLSVAVNLIPGVYAAQYLTGKDWVTGESIDRGNPLNIIGAVGSGFAAFSAVRGAVAGVQGLRAAQAGYSAAKSIGDMSRFSAGTMQAIEGANLVAKFDKGLKLIDYAKVATPLINRFGEAGRLSQIGRGYTQGMQLAAGAAAMKKAADGSVVVDKAMKARVLGDLKQGKPIQDALAGVQRSAGGARPALDNAQIAKLFNNNGFVQGGGAFKFNPFKRDATIGLKANQNGVNVWELGRGMNLGSRAGLAQGVGTIQAQNLAKLSPAMRSAATASSGVSAAAISNAGMDGAYVAKWVDKLGVTKGTAVARLFDTTAKAAVRTSRLAQNGPNGAYGFASRIAAIPSNSRFIVPGIVAGAVTGATGKQLQPMWEVIKQDPGTLVGNSRAAKEHDARVAAAEEEKRRLEQLEAGQVPGDTGAAPTDPNAQSGTPQQIEGYTVVGTSQAGNPIVEVPELSAYVDTVTGDIYDPATQQIVGNLSQLEQQGATPQDATQQVDPNVQAGGDVSVDPYATTVDPYAASQGDAPETYDGAAQELVPGGQAGVTSATPAEPYIDQATGFWVDPATGMMADPDTGDVYDPATGQVVANLNAAQ